MWALCFTFLASEDPDTVISRHLKKACLIVKTRWATTWLGVTRFLTPSRGSKAAVVGQSSRDEEGKFKVDTSYINHRTIEAAVTRGSG